MTIDSGRQTTNQAPLSAAGGPRSVTAGLVPLIRRLSSFPVVLLLLCLAGFVPLIYRLGFYWDDWPSIWFLHAFGAGSFRQGFSADRPLLAWVFMLTTSLIGESPLGWQLFGVFTRWLAGILLWWTLRGLRLIHPREAGAAAILFTLYPGFGQQYISVTYANAFLVFSGYLASLGCMVWALHASAAPARKWVLLGLSFLAAGLSLFTSEYFTGLELLRPVLLWMVLRQPVDESSTPEPGTRLATGDRAAVIRSQLRRLTLYWLPYLVLLVAFVAFRLSDKTPRAKVTLFDELRSNPGAAVVDLGRTIGQDFIEVNFLAWVNGLNPGVLNDYDLNVVVLLALSVLFSAALAGAYGLWRAKSGTMENGQASSALVLIALGLYAYLVSGLPVWVTNLRIELFFPWDRLTLMTMLSTALLISGLVALAGRWRVARAGLMALAVGLAVWAQFQYRLSYRQEWLAQQSFFWQLTWRAPGLVPGTLLLTSEIPFTYYTDNSLSAPLNWIYDPNAGQMRSEWPQVGPTPMHTLLYDIEARLGKGLPQLEPNTPVHEPYRAAAFDGSTSQALVLFYDPPRCLKIMDPAVDRFLPVKPLYIREAAPLSRLELIETNPAEPARPPERFFGTEPAPTWCYYFEKVELYNQMGAWQQAAELADKALKTNKHFTEKNISELNPFIEAYAHNGKWQKAVDLTANAAQTWDKMQYGLCDVWTRIQQTTPDSPERQAALQKIQHTIGCRFP